MLNNYCLVTKGAPERNHYVKVIKIGFHIAIFIEILRQSITKYQDYMYFPSQETIIYTKKPH